MSITSAYIHIPFCRRRCFYCDFPITVLGNNAGGKYSPWQREYVDFLCQEILTINNIKSVPLETVFFGGGTPSLLAVEGLEKILVTLENHFSFAQNIEISMEIDPATFSLEQLRAYQTLGVNRISLGVQSFDDYLLQECGRSHSTKDTYQSVEYIHQVGIDNWSLDLISGLPHQTITHWEDSLLRAIDLKPKHLSCYDLVIESGTVFGKKYQAGDKPLPQDYTTAQMYRLGSTILQENGYNHYEICNYAQKDYHCKHNLVYWRNQPYYGFGMGAASYTQKQRFSRPRTRKEYFEFVNQLVINGGKIDCEATTATEELLDTFMLGLRLKEGVNLPLIEKKFGTDTVSQIIKTLQASIEQKLVIFSNDKKNLKLSDPEGFLYSNSVLTELFMEFE
ncbi:radical SAM family heme chaperone HemW [Cyanobacterium sp. IPPAS B-1200]|uniref:radical SAM family heme chaperone HemW n=1 Tax=Cyanobacterium sp. IPPAS B-1200 TaxID=1562720 RepID=UPI0008524CFC|nr:radical SAM family heme chaperone HemW [Cyanobacterium sp. IPPAS B-1200]OEJ79216.1 coproporphyrinogen III oxidase [Cyanobacterium sp. IPPAS B-1200]